MNKAIKDRIHLFIKEYLSNDPDECQAAGLAVDEDFKLLGRQGISLTNLQASTADKDFGLHPIDWRCLLEGFQEDNDGEKYLSSKVLAAFNNETGPDSQHSDLDTWCSDPVHLDGEQLELAEALFKVRRWLVLSSKQQGFQGVLADQQLMQALPLWLQYVPCLEIAVDPGRLVDNLLSLLPAAVRAWLLADVAAGLLLAGDRHSRGGQRWQLPDTPQHHAAFQSLLSRAFAGFSKDSSFEEDISEEQDTSELQQLFAGQQQVWQKFQRLCNAALTGSLHQANSSGSSSAGSVVDGNGPHYEQQAAEQQSPAVALLAGVHRTVCLNVQQDPQSKTSASQQQQQQDVYLPQHVAAVLADDIRGDSCCWVALHACLCSMSVALVQELQSEGARLGLQAAFINRQQVQLQSSLLQMLAPVQQEATAAGGHRTLQQKQLQSAEGLSAVLASADINNRSGCEAAVDSSPGRPVDAEDGVLPDNKAPTHLDPAKLATVVDRVTAFVQAVHAARDEQQKEVLLQLQRQLKALHEAVKQQSSSSSSSSSNKGFSAAAAAPASAAGMPPHQETNCPDIAELVGPGILGVLLQLDLQKKKKQHQGGAAGLDNLLLELQRRAAPGEPLKDFQGTENLITQADPECLWMYYRVRTAADKVFGPRQQQRQLWGSAPWHIQHLQHLLVAHGGLRPGHAEEIVNLCIELHTVLHLLAAASAEAAFKHPVLRYPLLVRVAQDECSSSNSTEVSVLPGFRVEWTRAHISQQQGAELSGAGVQEQLDLLGRYGLCSLLVRVALSHLPGQQQQQQVGLDVQQSDTNTPGSSAAAAAGGSGGGIKVSQTLLKRQLIDRLTTLRHLHGLFQPILDNLGSVKRLRLFVSERTIKRVVHQLTEVAFPDHDAAMIVFNLQEADEQHDWLVSAVAHRLHCHASQPHAADSAAAAHGFIDDSRSVSPEVKPTSTAAAAAVAATSTLMTQHLLIQCFKDVAAAAGLSKVLQQHCSVWGPAAGSSRSNGAADAMGLSAESVLLMLAALQTTVCRHLVVTMKAAEAAQQSATDVLKHCSKMAEVRGGFLQQPGTSSGEAVFKQPLQQYQADILSYDHMNGQLHTLLAPQTAAYEAWQKAAEQLRQLVSAAWGLALEVLVWSQVQMHRHRQCQQQQQQQQQQHRDDDQQQQQQIGLLQEIHSRAAHLASIAPLASYEHHQTAEEKAAAEQAHKNACRAAVLQQLESMKEHADRLPAYLRQIRQMEQVRQMLQRGAQQHHEVLTAAADHYAAAALGLLAGLRAWRLPDWEVYSCAGLQDSAQATGSEAGRSQDEGCSRNHSCDWRLLSPRQRQQLVAMARCIQADSGSKSAVLELLQFISSSNSKLAKEQLSQLQHINSRSSSSRGSVGPDVTVTNGSLAESQQSSSYLGVLHDMQQAAWQLLLALKPSYCRVIHMCQLPQQFRTHENFEVAVLGQPLQQQQQRKWASSTAGSQRSSRTCHCGKPEADCISYNVVQQQLAGPLTVHRLHPCVLCGEAACVARELHCLSQLGPPDGLFRDVRLIDPNVVINDVIFEDLVVLRPDIRCLVAMGEERSETQLRQMQQYARALQVSICKSGTPAGLVRRLLLLEAIRHPGEYSLLHPKLLPAWRQQMMHELVRVAVPAADTVQQLGKQQSDEATDTKQQEHMHRSNSSSSSISSSCSSSTVERALLSQCNPDLWHAMLHDLYVRQAASRRGSDSDSDQQADCGTYDAYCFSAACRTAVCCWVLCWHCCVEERGGAYNCVVTRAAAAEAASDLIGDDQLQHIRLPAWARILPQPAAGELAVDATDHSKQQPSVWWKTPSSSSSSSNFSNQRWLSTLASTSAAAGSEDGSLRLRCDYCCRTVPAGGNEGSRVEDQQQMCFCPGCGVAVYCSRSCADKDKEQHRPDCRLLTRISGAGGISKDWSMLTATAETSASGITRPCSG